MTLMQFQNNKYKGKLSYLKTILHSIKLVVNFENVVYYFTKNNFITNNNVTFQYDGKLKNIGLIFSTSKGVFIFDSDKGIAKQVMKGKYYGITRYNDSWLIDRIYDKGKSKSKRFSNIYIVKIKNYEVVHKKLVLFGIPHEVHQIDLFNDHLYIPNTGYNQILRLSRKKIKNKFILNTILSCDNIYLNVPRPSHLNSIFYDKQTKHMYLIAHNSTAHTDRCSDILKLDEKSLNLTTIKTKAHSAHNIYIEDELLFYCDSQNKILYKNKKPIFRADKLLRGLSVTKDKIYVGGSDICFDRDKRNSSDVAIYVLDKNGKKLAEITFPKLGNIYEIRQYELHDYAMSESIYRS